MASSVAPAASPGDSGWFLGLAPTRRDAIAVWGGGVALALLLGLLSSAARPWAAAGVALAVLIVGAYYGWVLGREAGLVVLLVVTSVADHFTFSVGPLRLRAEQIAAAIALCFLVFTELRAGRKSWLKPSLAEGLLLAWLACSALSSILVSPDRRLSAKVLVLIAICSLGLFLPRRLLRGPRGAAQLEVVTRWLLVVFATESTYGSLTYLLHVFGPTISIGPNPASGHLESYGTLWEQNVFGAFAAAGAVAWVYLGPSRFKWAALGLAACIGGLFDSLTRAAWLAAALVGALGVATPGLWRRIDKRMVGVGALISLVVIAATLAVDRVAKYNVLQTGGGGGKAARSSLLSALLNVVDLAGRLNQSGPVWSDIRGRLALGRGTGSFEALHQVQGVPQHIASLPLLVINDTGVIGLALFVCFAIAVIVRAWSVRTNAIVLGLGQAAIVIALANLATETTELMIGWLLIGVLLAACDAASTATTAPVAGPHSGASDIGQTNL
jgi:hypothetical protein